MKRKEKKRKKKKEKRKKKKEKKEKLTDSSKRSTNVLIIPFCISVSQNCSPSPAMFPNAKAAIACKVFNFYDYFNYYINLLKKIK